MKVSFDRTATFDEIFADPDFVALRERFASEVAVRQFVPSVIRQFREAPMPNGLARYANHWASSHPTSPPDMTAVITETAALLAALYRTWAGHLTNLRGALVEGLVLAQLESRYGQNQLEDNAVINLENDIEYTSPTSVDVTGWDGNRGECHDCKTRAKWVGVSLVRSLEENLPEPDFRVGVVTTDSGPVMVTELKKLGYTPAPITELIPLEDLWELAPLQRPVR